MNLALALPIMAIVLTLIVMLLLWYWWSSSREEQEPANPTVAGAPTAGQYAQTLRRVMALVIDVFYTLRDWLLSTLHDLAPSVIPVATSGSSGSRTVPVRQTGELVEAVRLFRDVATGGLVVEVGSRRYSALSEMTDDTVRRRFLGIAESMAQFAAGAAPLPPVNIPAAVVAPPVPAPVSQPTDVKKGDKVEPPPPEPLKSVAEEIEELLQYRLTITPEFSQRSIHIRESYGGAIQVEVDGHYYDGIGEVADETVKTFLQDIVREWEARK